MLFDFFFLAAFSKVEHTSLHLDLSTLNASFLFGTLVNPLFLMVILLQNTKNQRDKEKPEWFVVDKVTQPQMLQEFPIDMHLKINWNRPHHYCSLFQSKGVVEGGQRVWYHFYSPTLPFKLWGMWNIWKAFAELKINY